MMEGIWKRTLIACSSHLVLLLVLCSSFCNGVQEYPKVSILRWMTAESTDWEFDKLSDDAVKVKDQEKETVYTVSQHLVGLAIVCNASYPVQWVFHHIDRMGMYNVRIRTYRDAVDINNTKTFKFSAVMDMYADSNKLTGAYSCQSTSSERIQNNIYVYWPGNSPPFFVHAGQTLTIKSEDNKTMILPCVVSSPDAQVELYKQIAGDYMIEPPSPYINWDPQVGFSLNMVQMDDPFGNYKCVVAGGDDEDDFVLMAAVGGMETKGKINNIIQGNATFFFDPATRQVKCCSSSGKPPNMRNMYCEDAITCKMKEQYVLQNGNNGIKFRNSSCTADRVYYRDSGVFRCKGDGIDIVRHFFSGYTSSGANETAPVYFNWHDADPTKLIELVSHYRTPGGKIYSNQTFYMSCDTSYYYFSEGIHWALKWRNQTVQFLNETYTAYQGRYRRSEMMHTIKLVGDVEMESLTCYAPVWNTTDWANKTHDLQIYQSAPPVLTGPILDIVTWKLNQTNQSIICNAEGGKPAPIIRWKRNNRVVLNDTNLTVHRSTGSSIITFKRVTHDTQGEYKCLAGNVAGRVEKTVRIIVQIPSSSSAGVATFVIITLIIITLAAGIGFLVWKNKLQKKVIDYLAGVHFRDMSGGAQNGQAGNRA